MGQQHNNWRFIQIVYGENGNQWVIKIYSIRIRIRIRVGIKFRVTVIFGFIFRLD